jgi:DNA repair protein SbcD/Mre11
MSQPDLRSSQIASLLFIGDLHLGEVPTRLSGAGLDPQCLTPVVAWDSAIELAIRSEVAAVVLAGDVVDDEQDRFEAYDQLERGVRRLLAHDVEVVAVAGNHDSLVPPRLAERIPAFRLLGRDSHWEHYVLPTDPQVDLLGWSFPSRHGCSWAR